jgi:hypothetical protein
MSRFPSLNALFCLFGSGFVMGCGSPTSSHTPSRLAESWNLDNDFRRYSWDFETNFDLLPLSGTLLNSTRTNAPWTDSYWPKYKGGIAYRWLGSTTVLEKLVGGVELLNTPEFLQAENVKKMSLAELAELSPAEKFDLLNGDYSFPTVQKMISATSPLSPTWEGYCHGWANASLNYLEPKAVLLESTQGIKIPFGSSDIKALLSYYQKDEASPMAHEWQVGSVCARKAGDTGFETDPKCANDVNAGSFHLVISNLIGLQKKGFVADLTRDLELWNHPVHSFRSALLKKAPPSQHSALGTVQEIEVETIITYVTEIDPTWDSRGTNNSSDRTKTYRYWLEMNANHEIIGGRWAENQTDRPDVLWHSERPTFSGKWLKLQEIYEASVNAEKDFKRPQR